MSEWISVEDRLPEEFEEVLCVVKSRYGREGKIMFGGLSYGDWRESSDCISTLKGEEVTHWMPLPGLPK